MVQDNRAALREQVSKFSGHIDDLRKHYDEGVQENRPNVIQENRWSLLTSAVILHHAAEKALATNTALLR